MPQFVLREDQAALMDRPDDQALERRWLARAALISVSALSMAMFVVGGVLWPLWALWRWCDTGDWSWS
jgi:hypothetical protein